MFKLFSKNIQISDDVHNIFYPCWIICLQDSLSLTKYLSQLTTFIPHILIKFTLRYSECHFRPWRKSPSYYFLPRWTKGTKVNTADCSTPLNASSQQIHKYTDTNTKTKTKTNSNMNMEITLEAACAAPWMPRWHFAACNAPWMMLIMAMIRI